MIFYVLAQALVHIVLATVVFAAVVCPVLLILGCSVNHVHCIPFRVCKG